jgi:hypothetical protein
LFILLFGSLAVLAEVNLLFIPDILAQKDFLLLADFEPGFNLLGLVVTAIDNLEPGFAAL